MPTKPLERLLFAQGGKCFFCDDVLSAADASVEHLIAAVNGGGNSDENCVACCKTLNRLFGRMSLKEKLGVILNQKGDFKCPNGNGNPTRPVDQQHTKQTVAEVPDERLTLVLADLQRRATSRPRTVKALHSTINALFKKQLTEAEVASLFEQLQTGKVISVTGTIVSYAPTPSGGS